MKRSTHDGPGCAKRRAGTSFGAIAAVAAGVCAVAGLGLIGVALASQRAAPDAPSDRSRGGIVDGTASRPPAARPPGATRGSSSHVDGPVLPASRPVTLKIPSIGVSSAVRHLGQEADGTLETPAGPHYDLAGWYRYSPAPGSLGPAILLGHVDSAANGPSVFFRLGELRAGDVISVGRADGSAAVFVVDEVHRYPKDDFPTKLVYDDIDHAGLRIVTCGGAFDASRGHYLDNVVVFASLRG